MRAAADNRAGCDGLPGRIAEDSIFTRAPFSRHGWVELSDKRIFDPTRWAFEAVAPYIHVGFDHRGEYDPGGNKIREQLLKPPPVWEPKQKSFTLKFETSEAARYAADLLGDAAHWQRSYRRLKITAHQAIWLGSLPLSMLGEWAKPIYAAFVASGHGAVIPLDNRQMILGDAYESETVSRTNRQRRTRKCHVS